MKIWGLQKFKDNDFFVLYKTCQTHPFIPGRICSRPKILQRVYYREYKSKDLQFSLFFFIIVDKLLYREKKNSVVTVKR